MKDKRKYLGIPTQEEVTQQFNEIKKMTKGKITLEQILELKKTAFKNGYNIEVELNRNTIDEYRGEPIECIRYEYKNLMVYIEVKDGDTKINPYVTLFDDEGATQFAEEKYYDYEKEIERSVKMGLPK